MNALKFFWAIVQQNLVKTILETFSVSNIRVSVGYDQMLLICISTYMHLMVISHTDPDDGDRAGLQSVGL